MPHPYIPQKTKKELSAPVSLALGVVVWGLFGAALVVDSLILTPIFGPGGEQDKEENSS